jgi:hypothetical protein
VSFTSIATRFHVPDFVEAKAVAMPDGVSFLDR